MVSDMAKEDLQADKSVASEGEFVENSSVSAVSFDYSLDNLTSISAGQIQKLKNEGIKGIRELATYTHDQIKTILNYKHATFLNNELKTKYNLQFAREMDSDRYKGKMKEAWSRIRKNRERNALENPNSLESLGLRPETIEKYNAGGIYYVSDIQTKAYTYTDLALIVGVDSAKRTAAKLKKRGIKLVDKKKNDLEKADKNSLKSLNMSRENEDLLISMGIEDVEAVKKLSVKGLTEILNLSAASRIAGKLAKRNPPEYLASEWEIKKEVLELKKEASDANSLEKLGFNEYYIKKFNSIGVNSIDNLRKYSHIEIIEKLDLAAANMASEALRAIGLSLAPAEEVKKQKQQKMDPNLLESIIKYKPYIDILKKNNIPDVSVLKTKTHSEIAEILKNYTAATRINVALRARGESLANAFEAKMSSQDDSLESLNLRSKINILEDNGINKVSELATKSYEEIYRLFNNKGSVSREVNNVINKLAQKGYLDSPAVIYLAKMNLYNQLEEMQSVNEDKSISIINSKTFSDMPLADCLKDTFFYRDYLFKAPEGMDYYITFPSMKIEDGLSGLYISKFAISEDEEMFNAINLSGSGATIDFNSIHYPILSEKDDLITYGVDFKRCNFDDCNVIGRLRTGNVETGSGLNRVKIVVQNMDCLPCDYLERRKRFHYAAITSSNNLLKRAINGEDLKGSRISEGTNLIDKDLSSVGALFNEEIEAFLVEKQIPYSLRPEMHKAKWLGESVYMAECGMKGFAFDGKQVSEEIREKAKIRQKIQERNVLKDNPTSKAYEFLAAIEKKDFKYLVETYLPQDNVSDSPNWFAEKYPLSGDYYKETIDPNKFLGSYERFGISQEQKQVIMDNTPMKINQNWQELADKFPTKLALEKASNHQQMQEKNILNKGEINNGTI